MVAAAVVADQALLGKLGQGGADGGGAQACEFAQALHRDGFLLFGQEATDALSEGWRGRVGSG